MKKIILSIIIVSGLFIKPATAQENIYSIQYTMGFSTGDFNDFISRPSFRGITFDYRNMVMDNLGVGVEFGWNAWYEDMDYDTYTRDNSSISGRQYRYCSTVPMMASVDYYILPGENFNPFAGVGIGTTFSSSELDMGIYALTVDTWHFSLKPEIGAIFKVGPSMGVMMSGKYYINFETSESTSRNYIAANVGLVWGF